MLERSSRQVESDLSHKRVELALMIGLRNDAQHRLNQAMKYTSKCYVITARVDMLMDKNGQVKRLQDDVRELLDELNWVAETEQIAADRRGAS